MSTNDTRWVDVVRKDNMHSIPFEDLLVGDIYSDDGEVWFVDSVLTRFAEVRARALLRTRGSWYLKLGVGNLVHPLIENKPFGKIDIVMTESIIGNPLVGVLSLSKVT